jgi:hypothetical protein
MIAQIDVEYTNGEPVYLFRVYENVGQLARKEKCFYLYELEQVIPTTECLEVFNEKRIEEKLHERFAKKTLVEDIG